MNDFRKKTALGSLCRKKDAHACCHYTSDLSLPCLTGEFFFRTERQFHSERTGLIAGTAPAIHPAETHHRRTHPLLQDHDLGNHRRAAPGAGAAAGRDGGRPVPATRSPASRVSKQARAARKTCRRRLDPLTRFAENGGQGRAAACRAHARRTLRRPAHARSAGGASLRHAGFPAAGRADQQLDRDGARRWQSCWYWRGGAIVVAMTANCWKAWTRL